MGGSYLYDSMNATNRGLWGYLIIILAGVLVTLPACNSEYSRLGGSLRPKQDIVTARGDTLSLHTRTVRLDSVYSRSNITLLGQLSDEFYGDLRASYISRLQCAPGFTFTHEPLGGKIDSVHIEIAYTKTVGDTTSWSKAGVYEVMTQLPSSRYSTDLSPYVQNAKYLGAATYRPADTVNHHTIFVPVDVELGYRFYEASKQHPEWFASQQAFEEHLMRGIYVKPSTGTGNIIQVFSTALRIYYTYTETMKSSTGADSIAHKPYSEIFTNTRHLYTHNMFEHTHLDNLLLPNPQGNTYIKAPAGVVTEVKLVAEELNQVLQAYQKMGHGEHYDWIINQANLKVMADVPNNSTHFNPPLQLLLMPQDSVSGFFVRSNVNPIEAARSFTSGSYSIVDRSYTFANVSSLIEAHIKRNMKQDGSGKYYLDKDLVLLLIPVSLQKGSSGDNTSSTIAVENYLTPAAVQLKFGSGHDKLGIIGTGFFVRQ